MIETAARQIKNHCRAEHWGEAEMIAIKLAAILCLWHRTQKLCYCEYHQKKNK